MNHCLNFSPSRHFRAKLYSFCRIGANERLVTEPEKLFTRYIEKLQ